MKKFLVLLLCAVMCTMSLVSCGKDVIGEYLENYEGLLNRNDRKKMELDFYIIVGEGTDPNSIVTVERMINSHLSDTLQTTLDIHFVLEEEYMQTVLADSAKTGDDRADIVLIAGEDMFNTMMDSHLLANITEYLKTDAYGTLNTRINKNLLDASYVTSVRQDITGKDYDIDYLYTIPNNRVLSSYDYILIDNDIASSLHYSPAKLLAMTSFESTSELLADVAAKRADLVAQGFTEDEIDNCVLTKTGGYEDKAKYEAQGYTCTIARYPTVDSAEAFFSAFAIVADETDLTYLDTQDKVYTEDELLQMKDPAYKARYDRCMDVIYALNTDSTLRNLLQYGVKNTNYVEDDNGYFEPFQGDENAYNMNLLYTGDVFIAAYSEAHNWNAEKAAFGREQNKQSVRPVVDDNE